MIELQDSNGRLIVVMPMCIRHADKLAYVFVDGKRVAEFASMGEAAKYARSLVERECSGPSAVPIGSTGE